MMKNSKTREEKDTSVHIIQQQLIEGNVLKNVSQKYAFVNQTQKNRLLAQLYAKKRKTMASPDFMTTMRTTLEKEEKGMPILIVLIQTMTRTGNATL